MIDYLLNMLIKVKVRFLFMYFQLCQLPAAVCELAIVTNRQASLNETSGCLALVLSLHANTALIPPIKCLFVAFCYLKFVDNFR